MVELWQRLEKLSRAKRALFLRQLGRLQGDQFAQTIPALAGRMSVEQMLEEAVLDSSVDPAVCGQAETGGAIFLTGATGFVGAYILDSLARRTDATIYCLARASSESEARVRIRENLARYLLPDPGKRIVPIPGNLIRPRFGTSEHEYEAISSEVSDVFHCAATVNWIFPYRMLRDSNVGGTEELLKFATHRRLKPFHFVSTVGVFSSPEYVSETVSEDVPLEESGALYVGYAQTKWVSERMVRHAADRGLPVSICRPNVGSDSRSGAFNASDHVNLLLKGCIQLGLAPDLDMTVAGAPVDYVGDSIVDLARNAALSAATYHLVNPNPLSWTQYAEWHARRGYRLPVTSTSEWRKRLVASLREGKENALSGLAPLLTESALDLAKLPGFDASQANAALEGSQIRCAPLDDQLLDRWWRRQVDSGFLDEPVGV
jgi:thioester reductase-like protein